MKCYIVKDLLPNYADGLNSEETNAEIRKHLENCSDCRALYGQMSTVLPQGLQSAGEKPNFLKKLKAKILRRNVIVAVSTCIVVLGSLLFFAVSYELPIPFDSRRMTVEIFPMAVVTNGNGSASWWELETIEQHGDITVESNTIIPETYDYVIDMARTSFQGFAHISSSEIGRDINRDGEQIRVVYYCYTKTPWDSLFFDYDLSDVKQTGSSYGTGIYGDKFESADYEPQMREIYYLPIRNLHELDSLSDEEFDAQRENGVLVWSGVI